MSLLTICQAVADDIGLDVRPVTIFGNTDVDALRLQRFAQRVGSDLAARAPWQDLQAVQTFTTTAGEVQAGAIPAGFLRFAPESMWDVSNGLSITGQVNPAEYAARKNGYATATYAGPMRWFTRQADALLIWPAPPAGLTFTFTYQSANFCASAGGTPQAAWAADSDVGRLSEELITLGMIYRFLLADGQPAQQQQRDYELRLAQEIANDAPRARVLPAGDLWAAGSVRFTGEPGSAAGRLW